MFTVLKRCVSALPKSTCPFIPSRYLQQIKSRSALDTSTPIRFPDTIYALSQISVQEPVMQCEERRQLGSFILNKKAEEFDSLLSRFVSNLIMHISDKASAQEVSSVWLLEADSEEDSMSQWKFLNIFLTVPSIIIHFY